MDDVPRNRLGILGVSSVAAPSALSSFFPLPDIDAHDHEPPHEHHLSEEGGEGDVGDLEKTVNRESRIVNRKKKSEQQTANSKQ